MKKTFALLALVFLVVGLAPRASLAQFRPCGAPDGPEVYLRSVVSKLRGFEHRKEPDG